MVGELRESREQNRDRAIADKKRDMEKPGLVPLPPTLIAALV
jgi:hypothetical protein